MGRCHGRKCVLWRGRTAWLVQESTIVVCTSEGPKGLAREFIRRFAARTGAIITAAGLGFFAAIAYAKAMLRKRVLVKKLLG